MARGEPFPIVLHCQYEGGKDEDDELFLEPETIEKLKALARRRHGGNVSALLAELAETETKLAAAEAMFLKYKVPPLTAERAAELDAEWAQLPAPLRRKRRKPAA